MTESTYSVQGMTCSHCAHAVSVEVGKIGGVTAVQVDVAAGLVTVSSEGTVEEAAVGEAVDEAGYTLVRA